MPENQIQVKLNPDVVPTGSDLAVVNAARRSFNQRSEWESNGSLKAKDKRLLEFLARGMTADDFGDFVESVSCAGAWNSGYLSVEGANKKELVDLLWEWRNTPTHDTPFNHCFISFEVKAPIFVARQLFKHEYLVASEFSRRYKTDDVEFYAPDYWRKVAENKKQGSLEEPVDIFLDDKVNLGYNSISDDYDYEPYQDVALDVYENLLIAGVAPEQARMVLPQSTLTEWTWSGTLGAFAKMCQLRLHPEAQYEARLVAKQVYEYLKEYYPVSAELLVEGVL